MAADAPRQRPSPGDGALAGALVAELGSRIGAGVCGSLLAQLGASVVVVEPTAAAAATGKWRHRALCAAGKLSFRPDLTKASDRDLLRDLLGRCDAAILSSDADGHLDGFVPAGIEAATGVCDVTAYGSSGALAGQAASEWQSRRCRASSIPPAWPMTRPCRFRSRSSSS